MECKNLASNTRTCNCTYPGCERKGLCCECLSYHRSMGQLPACYFTKEAERTWDRSVDCFLKTRKK